MSKTRNLSDLLDANGDVKATALDNTALSTISGDSDDITEGSTNLFLTTSERTKLSGIETSATADQTDAEIKTAYENNSDTNAFTDAEQTKLSGIETGATADQTASEILTAIKTVDGTGSGLDADLLDGNEASAFATSAQGSTADSALQNVSEDATPQLGGDLDLNSNDVTGTGNINITGTLQTSSNAIIGGDLTVSGTTTTVNTETINLADNNIVLNSNHTGTPTQNAGITIERGTSTDKVFQWNESSDYWETDDNFNVTGNITVSGTVDGRDIAADGTTLDAVASTYVNVSGDTLTGDLAFGDNVKATFGDDSELEIYYDGSKSIIRDIGTGNLQLRGANFQVTNAAGTENMILALPNGAVSLYYDNAQKIATTSTGIDVTGTVTADGFLGGTNVLRINSLEGSRGSIQISAPHLITREVTYGNNFYLASDGTYTQDSAVIGGGLLQITAPNAGFGEFLFKSKQDPDSGGAVRDRLKIANTGDISFYDDAGTSQDFYWDASTSRLGIGTTSPSYQLHIGGTTDNTVAQFKSTDDTSQILISDDDTNGYLGVRNDFIYISPTSSTGADGLVVRTDTGNVGIGTASPDKALVVEGVGAEIVINDTDTTDTPLLRFRESGSTSGTISTNSSNLIFTSGTTEAMRIDSSGNVGIGTTSPTQALDVNGSIASDISINAQTGTTYTTVLTDRSKLVTLDNASAVTVTIPPNSSVAYPTGTKIDLLAKGAGQVTVAEGSGVTVNSSQSLKLRAQWSAASVIKLATDTWVLVGDLQAV